MALLSAHRCGAQQDLALENTREAIERATLLATEFVEFDVQRTADGVFVLFHDDRITIDEEEHRIDELTHAELGRATHAFVRYEEALEILAGAGKRAHIDLKFTSPDEAYEDPAAPYEVVATRLAIELMGVGAIIITTLEDASVKAIRAWAAPLHPELLVGLSLGRDMTGRRRGETLRTRLHELFPRTRIKACDANLVVANKALARLTLARFAARRRLPLLVWTVDDPGELWHWIGHDRAWLVTTNYPQRAELIRTAREAKAARSALARLRRPPG